MLVLISGLGSKKNPVHVLVPHGVLPIRNAPAVEYHQLRSWFQESDEGCVEGIVWHCNDGVLVKVTPSSSQHHSVVTIVTRHVPISCLDSG